MVAIVRRDALDRLGRVGTSAPPYADWTWNTLPVRVGGPALLRLPDGGWLLGTREYGAEDRSRTVLGRVTPEGAFETQVTLQSGGDTSYLGLVLDGDDVLVSRVALSRLGR